MPPVLTTLTTSDCDHPLAAAAKSAHDSFTIHQRPYIAERWKSYEPWMVIESRRHSDPASRLYNFKLTHAMRLHRLLAVNINWEAIREYRLDDPVMSDDAFDTAIRAAIERRRSRMGRVKGQGRKYKKEQQDGTRTSGEPGIVGSGAKGTFETGLRQIVGK